MAATVMLCLAATATPSQAMSEDVQIDAEGGGRLAGTWLTPAGGDGPVALIVPGSGPTDRDGNSPLGVAASTYRLLAEALAERGIATLRADKRGMFASTTGFPDPNAVTIAGYAGDARAWAGDLTRRSGRACVWLIGHSEGGLIASVAARDEASVCGVVLMAAPGRPMAEVLRGQLRTNPANAPLLDQALAAIDRLEAGERVDIAPLHPALHALFAPAVQDFVIDQMRHDPAAELAKTGKPALIVQGDRDIQVSVADAARLAAAKADAELVVAEGVNHVLKAVADDRAANLAAYADPALPIAPKVVEAVADFILRHEARP